jgi:hypothetical protein
MANTVDQVHITTFEANLRALAQQGQEKLRNWCQVSYEKGEAHNFDMIGLVEAVDKVGRAVDSPIAETPFSRRKAIPSVFHAGDLVEPEDTVRAITDPTSPITQALAKGMRRKMDARVIAAATGQTRDGAGNLVNFDAAQVVGDYTGELDFDFVGEVFEKFTTNELIDEEKVFVIGPRQLRKLQKLVQYTSSDYVHVKALAEKGYTERWMGFTWIVHGGLLAGGGAGTKDCFAMTRNALGLHIPKDIWAEVEKRADKSMANQLYTAALAGAIRVEDEQVVWCKVADTVGGV